MSLVSGRVHEEPHSPDPHIDDASAIRSMAASFADPARHPQRAQDLKPAQSPHRAPRSRPCHALARVFQSVLAAKVSQSATSPVRYPFSNQRARCSDVPWVNVWGVTALPARFCK